MHIKKTLTMVILLSTAGMAQPCSTYKTEKNTTLCEEMKKKNIDIKYIEKFLTQDKSKIRDNITMNLISPKEISNHKKKEKKANNNLLNHLEMAKKHLTEYKKVYDYVEKKYNVDREIIVGVMLKETILGNYKPKHDVYITLNTTYQETKPDTKRNKWLVKLSKTNLIELASYCYSHKIEPKQCSFPSSYIGAIGIPQFMPMNLYLAKSYSGKNPDLTKLEDAIVSIGNYFNKRAHYNKLINWSKIPNVKTVEEDWYDFSNKYENTSFAKNKKGTTCFSCDIKNNSEINKYVEKIMRYNNSSNYAIGVFRLGWELHKYRKNN